MQETPVWFLDREVHWRRDRLPTPVFLGLPCGSVGKESTCNVADLGLIPGLGRSPGEGKGYPLQYCGLENSMDCIVHKGCNESDTIEWLLLSLLTSIAMYNNGYTVYKISSEKSLSKQTRANTTKNNRKLHGAREGAHNFKSCHNTQNVSCSTKRITRYAK